MPDSDSNGRVTMAILGERIAQMDRRMMDGFESVNKRIAEQTARIDKVLDDHTRRIDTVEDCTSHLQERMRLLTAIGGGLQALVTGVVAWWKVTTS